MRTLRFYRDRLGLRVVGGSENHWQTRLVTRGAEPVVARLGQAHFVSPGVVALPDAALGFGKGVLVRDPDGHAVQVIERRGEP